MTIRRMTSVDLVQVLPLAEQLGYPNSLDDLRARFEIVVKDSRCALFVAVDGDDQVVGWTQIQHDLPSLLSAPRAELAALVVDARVRGRGIGKELLSAAEAWARGEGLEKILVRSNITRDDGHRFYKREGYAQSKTSHVFVKSLAAAPRSNER